MKNYFYRYFLKGLFLALFCVIAAECYAITFDEPRRVIIPKYANAVYRDLTVLDKMYWDTATADKQFLLELGKRPTYFWNKNQMYYLYQAQKLNLDKINYGDSSVNKNVFTIANVTLKNGSFISEKLFFAKGSLMQVNRNSNLLINYKGDLLSDLILTENVVNYNVYARIFGYTIGRLTDTKNPRVHDMFLRDVQFNGVKFPSPRLMVYYNTSGSFYQAQGTALNYSLPSISAAKAPHSYYGPWELWGTTNKKGILYPSSSGSDPCGGNRPDRCYTQTIDCGRGTDPGPGCLAQQPVYDTDDLIFTCVGKKYDGTTTGNYDHPTGSTNFCKDYCYDYQVVNIAPNKDNFDAPENYNGNKAYYEFRVEETFQYENTPSGKVVHFISQRPKTRVSTNNLGENEKLLAISTMTAAGEWTIVQRDAPLQRFYIDGTQKTVASDPKFIGSTDDNPCFDLCNGGLCADNVVYIRNVDSRELKGGTDSGDSLWPEQEGHKQHLIIRTYTLGFCPKAGERTTASNSNYYGKYEDNYGSYGKLIEAMLIKQGDNWTNAKVCMRRKVKCNAFVDEGGNNVDPKHFNRKYKPLSTDY